MVKGANSCHQMTLWSKDNNRFHWVGQTLLFRLWRSSNWAFLNTKKITGRDNGGISDSTCQVRAECVGRGISLVAHRGSDIWFAVAEHLVAAKPPKIQEQQLWAGLGRHERDHGSWAWSLMVWDGKFWIQKPPPCSGKHTSGLVK